MTAGPPATREVAIGAESPKASNQAVKESIIPGARK
jgi:hypothetical protein